MEPGDVQLILRGLYSVLDVSSDSSVITVHHASFLDFLQDQRRSSSTHIDLQTRMNVARAVLTALSDDSHWLDNPSDPLAWRLGAEDFIKCIILIPPTVELIPLIQRLNPDFLLWQLSVDTEKEFEKVLNWLREIRPVPESLIQRWEDYVFMFLWDSRRDPVCQNFFQHTELNGILSLSVQNLRVLQAKMSGSLPVSELANCRQFLARSPDFARIFLARWLLYDHILAPYMPSLYRLRLVLGVSWADITAGLSVVRSIIGGGSREQVVGGTITILGLVLELYPTHFLNLTSDLGCGLLRLIQRVGAGNSAPYWWHHFTEDKARLDWGAIIRCSSSSSPGLLSELHKFVPSWDWFPSTDCPFDCLCPADFYHIVKWLKTLPDPPLELVGTWEEYLTESRDRVKDKQSPCYSWCRASDEDFERDFERNWLKWIPRFKKSSQTSEEWKVIRILELAGIERC
ncbi:hypothetical protein B0H14DRAFT_2713624 [Mycena olivaceomarginata]|nr:hypothetical protein B0H14DRAFT_2713624 [Mycena olivaceomarginata]